MSQDDALDLVGAAQEAGGGAASVAGLGNSGARPAAGADTSASSSSSSSSSPSSSSRESPSASASASALLSTCDMCEYASLGRLSVRSRMKRLESIYQEMDQQWKMEVAAYERGGSDGDAHDDRNYANNSRAVVHENLFPYHDALYPLLDVYYHLAGEDRTRAAVCIENYPSPILATTERRQMQLGEANVPGYLPNSAYAVFVSLVPRYRAAFSRCNNMSFEALFGIETRNFNRAGDFSFLFDWERHLRDDEEVVRDGKWMSTSRVEYESYLEELRGDDAAAFGPHKFPTDCHDGKTRAMILTKIVKHALSDLQKDHRLAQASLMLMAELRLFDDTDYADDDGNTDRGNNNGADTLARLLAVVASEYVDQCDWRCHERYVDFLQGGGDEVLAEDDDAVSPPTHFCSDWKDMVRTISTCISNGITFVTEAHAETIAGFVLLEYDGISSAAAEIDRQYFESVVPGGSDAESEGSTTNSLSFLKQNLFYHNNTTSDFWGAAAIADPAGNELGGRDALESFRLSMVCSLVDGLGCHAAKERTRLKKVVDMSQTASGDATAQRELLCRTVASYRNCIRTLVSIGEHTIRRFPPNTRSSEVGAAIVRALVLASVDHDPSMLADTGYIGGAIANSEGKNLIDPTRFADAVTKAAENAREESENLSVVPGGATIEDAALRVLFSAPHRDVRDVIKGLFLRDLVDTGVAGFGYGDYLVWCRLPITPLDPLLYAHSLNFPDFQHEEEAWVVDEEGKGLTGPELASRFDFTILMLQRAWQEAWTPQSHRSFSIQHKDAMKAIALCAWKCRMPNEIALRVNSFLPRSWWPDNDRKQCWCHDCQLMKLSTLLREKITAREAPPFPQQDGGTQISKPSTTSIPSTQAQIPATMHNISLMRPLSSAQPKNSASADLFECECGVVYFCSKEHRKYLIQDGHKRMCGTPPFRPHGIDEELLCREVFATSQDELCFGGSDDDSCWESIDSTEDEENEQVTPAKKTKTELIFRFFDRHSYKALEVESPALAGHTATAFPGP